MKYSSMTIILLLAGSAPFSPAITQDLNKPLLQFDFEKNLKSKDHQFSGTGYTFAKGIDGQALSLRPDKGYGNLHLDGLSLDGSADFSVQFWVKTTYERPTVMLSQKAFTNKGIIAQQNAGWVLYSSGGTFAWSIGSGDRRINYERDNGQVLPINDGRWHLLTMTYSKDRSEFRLYYDGHNKANYKVGFDFANNDPLVIGAIEDKGDRGNLYSPEIEVGAIQLQKFVDEYNSLGLESLKAEELIELIIHPKQLFKKNYVAQGAAEADISTNLDKVLAARRQLMSNPYTVHQNRALTGLKPISKIYSLQGRGIVINDAAAQSYTMSERLNPADFAMDELSVWDRVISADEVLDSFSKYRKPEPAAMSQELRTLTVGVWNIFHGGIHWTVNTAGWDSRLRIVEILKEKNVDVILMQETYSSGDFIAAELGYYFATTTDWDYCFQGANISVISRYPIQEIEVSRDTEFNNVAVKLALSKTQSIYAMSNWYGMRQFDAVFDFHQSRFANADKIPVLFGGDFNAVPITDGGGSHASSRLLEDGFTDAFRSLYPDVDQYPGFTHWSDKRIDQLYYKGKGLKNTSTEVISSWPGGFPSDHSLIVSRFDLNYSTR